MKNLKLTALFGKVYAWTFVDGRWSLHRLPEGHPAATRAEMQKLGF